MRITEIFKKGTRYFSNPVYRFDVNAILGLYDDKPEEEFLAEQFYLHCGQKLNLENPTTFCEKIQWLKIHDRDPKYNLLVDKHEVKSYVANLIGAEYVIDSYGVWNNFDEIDFDALPNQFVLKCTHDSGGIVIVKDKATFDVKKARRVLEKHLKRNLYRYAREWVYKDVKPRILAEKFMAEVSGDDLTDYKFYCFNGEPKFCQVIANRRTDESIDFFDMDWTHQEFIGLVGLSTTLHNSATPIPSPKNFALMKKLAGVLAEGSLFRRIDFYEIDGKVYFGEITFYPNAGLGTFTPDKWNKILGNMLVLPIKK